MDIALNTLELAILTEIVSAYQEKYTPIQAHLNGIVVKSRTKTKTGMCIQFDYAKPIAPLTKEGDLLEALLTADKVVQLPSLTNGLGFVLDIAAGLFDTLDIYTNKDEKWDGDFTGFELVVKNTPS
jgi:hypothetical protein